LSSQLLPAVIAPSSCVTDCQECCTDWNGFSYDPIGFQTIFNGELTPWYLLSWTDNDPTNDIFQITDISHPFCAYGITGYRLIIRQQYQAGVIYDRTKTSNACCLYTSPAVENPIAHAGIWWDGFTSSGNRPEDGVHFYDVFLHSCTGAELHLSGLIGIDYMPFTGIATSDSMPLSAEGAPEQLAAIAGSLERLERMKKTVELSPNPATDKVNITGADGIENLAVQIFDEKGNALTRKEDIRQRQFDVLRLSPGTYYVRIYAENEYFVKKFVKL
jgi:hypothetical protein